MKKAVIFDFDGVILESTQVKIDAFRELFSQYPDHVDDIVAYHIEHGGISRFVKFRHIYQNMLKQELTKEKEIELGKEFTRLALEQVLNVPYVRGAQEFLEDKRDNYLFFVASGTPQEELDTVVEQRKMSALFDGIYGSPQIKQDIIMMILDDCNLDKEEVIFVGDANSDRLAAKDTDVDFIYRVHDESEETADEWVIPDLVNISDIIVEIENKKRSIPS